MGSKKKKHKSGAMSGALSPATEASSQGEQKAETARTLFVCVRNRDGKGASCAGGGALALMAEMRAMLAGENIGADELAVRPCGCLGLCKRGPVMMVAAGPDALGKKPPKQSPAYTCVEPDEARLVLRDALLRNLGSFRSPRKARSRGR